MLVLEFTTFFALEDKALCLYTLFWDSILTLSKYYKIINLLRPDRLILWDRETKEKFEEYRNNVDDEPDDDDEDE